MKQKLSFAILGVAVFLMSGCATNMYLGGPSPAGILVTKVSVPAQKLTVQIDPTAKPEKVGRAQVGAFLGLFAGGDASVQAAMKNGGITKVHHIDQEVEGYLLGIWSSNTTVVYGE
jgi:hypothetical protein